MKWREPWKQSMTRQGRLPQVRRRLVRGFLVWLAVFAALVVAYASIGNISAQDLLGRLALASGFALAMSVFLYLIWLLSPRTVDSGPRGIVLTKADEMLLIPWQAIASFQLVRATMPGSLLLRLHSGEEHTIALAHNVSPTEITREITKKTGVQP